MSRTNILKSLSLAGVISISLISCKNPASSNSLEPLDSDADASNLVLLREEEKLARDVYRAALEETGIPVFGNIASSEQKHMDRMLALLDANGIADPALAQEGMFRHSGYQDLYVELLAKVKTSPLEALKVGATIEDLDIADIESYLAETTNESVLSAYASLMCGSRNHLRSFVAQIELNGQSYAPQFISAATYAGIVGSDREKCGNQ